MRLFIFMILIFPLFYLTQLSAQTKTLDLLPVVEVTTTKLTTMSQTISANGVAKPIHSVIIASEVPGIITKVLFKSGERIQAGQVLLELDHQDVSAQLEQEVAKYAYQKRNMQRYAVLAKQGVITRDNLDKLHSDLTSEKATIDELTANVAKRVIRAPFAGVLGLKQVEVGQYIKPGDQIASLQQSQVMLVDLNVSLQQMNNIRVGQWVEFATDNAVSATGKIAAIDSNIDAKTYSLLVRVVVNNPTLAISPGAYLTAKIVLPAQTNVIVLPQSAIKYGLNGESIFVIRDNHAYQQAVQSESTNNEVVIKQGLKPNEQVVVAGQDKLYDGITVQIKLRS